MYPSPILINRRADMAVHAFGLAAIVVAGGTLLLRSAMSHSIALFAAVCVYVACALASNLASSLYHFAPWHAQRKTLRRLDHSAIYLSITGTFTPLLVQAATPRTIAVLALCWALSLLAIWHKLTAEAVKSRWSTASYLALGCIGLSALPDLSMVPHSAIRCILAGSACYAIGTVFYSRKSLPFRYAIWHTWVMVGGMLLFAAIWLALSPS